MNYIVLAHSPHMGITTRIKGCDYRDARERFCEIYGDEYEVISITKVPAGYRERDSGMKYELYDLYETEADGFGELICASDDMAEIRLAAKLRSEETDGECHLFVREWI